jgi:hypothetical protein
MKKDPKIPDTSKYAVKSPATTGLEAPTTTSAGSATTITFSSRFEGSATSLSFHVFFTAEGNVNYTLNSTGGKLGFKISDNSDILLDESDVELPFDGSFTVPNVKDEFKFTFTRHSEYDDVSFTLTCTY